MPTSKTIRANSFLDWLAPTSSNRKEAVHVSHIVKIKTQVRDPAAVQAACKRLGLNEPVHGKTKLFSGRVTGLAVQLQGWHYPVVFDTTTAQAHFDNFNGHWGDQKELDRFLQAYAVEKAKLEARKKGHSVTEQALANGSIKVSIQVAGGAA
jgi:hypothetical protein